MPITTTIGRRHDRQRRPAGGRGVAAAIGGCGLLELAGELIVGASQGVQHWARITGEPW